MNSSISYDYSPKSCDLCGNTAIKIMLNKLLPRSIFSDNKIVPIALRKIECASCGLVRDGHDFDAESLNRLYQFEYTLNINSDEYHFLTREGAIPRSKLFFDWIWGNLDIRKAEHFQKVLEIGCGSGHLLERMQSSMPHAQCFATEFSETAQKIAIEKGCKVTIGGIEQVSESEIDFVYAVGVLEHVPHPGNFLKAIRERLSSNGTLVLIQPTQDIPSSDVYFSDHLHHFGTDHLSMYAQKIGFTEIEKVVGHPLMPNFSFHMWQPTEPNTNFIRWGITQCHESVTFHEDLFERVNHLVAEIQRDPSRKLAVFGLNERYALLSVYSRLGEAEILCGLSDVVSNVQVNFPVVKPELVKEFPVTDVILCVNQIHYNLVCERLSPLGVVVHAV